MKSVRAACCGVVLGSIVVACGWLVGAEPTATPKAPKMSTFAPAKELLRQVDYYRRRLESALAERDRYNIASVARVQRDSNTLVVLLLVLGLHDEEHALRAAAPDLVASARKIHTGAEQYDVAKAACDELAIRLEAGRTADNTLAWEKQYNLGLLMKQAEFINMPLRRSLRKDRFARDQDKSAAMAAVLAAFAQATLMAPPEGKSPAELNRWAGTSANWRDAAGALGQAIRDQDYPAASAVLDRMTKSCSDCHAVFRKQQM